MESTAEERLKKRIMWRSRRGMWELDLLFRPFVEQCYPQLSEESRQLLDELLDLDDVEILDLTRDPAVKPKYQSLIEDILHYKQVNLDE